MNYTKENLLQLATDIICVLNSAVALDPVTMHKLTETRVPCNKLMAEHPAIQVQKKAGCTTSGAAVATEEYAVGLLGILNGITGTDDFGNGYIAGEYDDTTKKLVRFTLNPNLGKATK